MNNRERSHPFKLIFTRRTRSIIAFYDRNIRVRYRPESRHIYTRPFHPISLHFEFDRQTIIAIFENESYVRYFPILNTQNNVEINFENVPNLNEALEGRRAPVEVGIDDELQGEETSNQDVSQFP